MACEDILDKLQKVRPNGSKKWMACCPSHDDSDPSLSVAEVDDGRILLHCFAGCSAHDVLSSIGMSLSDLYPNGAINQQLHGWAQTMQRGNKAQQTAAEKAKILLAVADGRRKAGSRLTKEELNLEREAFLTLKRLERNA